MHRIFAFTVAILFTLCLPAANAQEIEVNGGFIEGEMKLGAPVQYFLTAKYPKKLEILFPGTDHTFVPFEIVEKESFPSTLIGEEFVFDSAIYVLNSFEIDPYQKLSLPVYLISANDSSAIAAPQDSIRFIELVAQVSDTTALKTNLELLGVPLAINTTYIYIGIGLVISILVILTLVFGIRVSAAIKVRRTKKAFHKFLKGYDPLVQRACSEQNSSLLEEAILHWKKYLEKLERRPYTKLTTRQMGEVKEDARLENALQSVDGIIYGKSWSTDISDQLNVLRESAKVYHERKIAAIKNG